MPSRRVPTDPNAGTYYVTLTVQRWNYLFDRHNRWQILADSIRYCQDNKGLELNGYVFMLEFPQGFPGEVEGVGVVDQAVEDGIGQGGIAQGVVPVGHRQLTGHQG
jgi:hypothetical protein